MDNEQLDIFEQRGGKRSYVSGKSFEDEIKKVCDYYFKNNIAYIQKFDHPRVFLREKNMVIYSKKKSIDFVGVVFETGRAIFIECKATAQGSIPIGNDVTGIKKSQIEILHKLEQYGVDAYILWLIRGEKRIFKIKPSWVVELLERGKKSINLIDLTKYNIPNVIPKFVNRTFYLDFLNKIR